ncbi:MAG: hypothetical protein RMJ39_10895, partial [Deltaproteobacteria bacterium]|nr:hypothetical protein [Deltaproteobacteria bacterium]
AIFIYLKPFESINRIQELPKAESKPRVIENFDINLPETSICVGNSYYGQKVVQIFRYHRQNKQIICNYDLPINDDFIIWLFKELEREFLGFVEAYEEERRRQQENEEEFVSIPHR